MGARSAGKDGVGEVKGAKIGRSEAERECRG